MSKKFINIIKLCVGAESVSDLYIWQKNRLIIKNNSKEKFTYFVTRMRPKREIEVLNGGSIYWVFKGLILARQKIVAFENHMSTDNILRCKIILNTKIYLTDTYQKKPFQGWRYFKIEDSPKDKEIFDENKKPLPLKIEKELEEIGIL